MITVAQYINSLTHAANILPEVLENWHQYDDLLQEEYCEQFRWLLEARFLFLSKAYNKRDYINHIMKFNEDILSYKEQLYDCMNIYEQDIIVFNN